MHLKAFEVRNYRAFVEPARIELRPLTLLFGYNNSGKSALARVLPLVRDSYQHRVSLPLNLEGPAARGATFSDLRSKQTARRTIEISFEHPENSSSTKTRLVFQDLPDRRQHFIESFEIESDHRKTFRGRSVMPKGNATLPLLYELQFEGEQSKQIKIGWLGLVPSFDPKDSKALGYETFPLGAYASVIDQLQTLQWVGAVRADQPRVSRIPRVKPAAIRQDGTEAAELLVWDKLHEGGEIFQAVSRWYELHAQSPLHLSIQGDQYALTMGRHQVGLSDTGEGLTQVLPVLTACLIAGKQASTEEAAYLVVEQPELHLHPAAHAPLAEFFCEIAAAEQAPRMLLETHSENFLFGVQIAVAEGRVDPAKVLIYWVHQDEQGYSSVTPIQLDQGGRPDYWPRASSEKRPSWRASSSKSVARRAHREGAAPRAPLLA